MVTKLKKFSRNIVTKGIVMLLTVIVFTSAVVQFALAGFTDVSFDSYSITDYQKSFLYNSDLKKSINRLMNLDYLYFQDEGKFIEYYCQMEDNVITNVDYVKNRDQIDVETLNSSYKTYFEKTDNYFCYSDGIWLDGFTKLEVTSHSSKKIMKAYLSFSQSFFQQRQEVYDNLRNAFKFHMIFGVVLIAIGFFMLVYLMLTTGQSHKKENIYINFIDKIYIDILIIILFNSFISRKEQLHYDIYYYHDLYKVANSIAIFSVLTLIILLSIIRRIKSNTLLTQSILYKLYLIGKDIYKFVLYGKHFRTQSPTKVLYYRQVIVFTLLGILYTLGILFYSLPEFFFTTIALFVLAIFWYVNGNRVIYQRIEKGIHDSLQDQVKSERTKIALITNVSHDLKTPLTSIISYVDLLSKEEGLSETATDYVKILQNKSNRLKTIVTDLFELAKSSSGDMVLEEELLDLKRLIEQTIADMEDKIQESKLQFKLSLPDLPVIIKSDGKKLYRVFQNIIDNALKYSLQNTRVYIDLVNLDQRALITFKNISSYEMNFTKEEILQRFYRGDQSRSTEGSGLGLSIAESFTINCGGIFDVEVDGDVFKVIIGFPT